MHIAAGDPLSSRLAATDATDAAAGGGMLALPTVKVLGREATVFCRKKKKGETQRQASRRNNSVTLASFLDILRPLFRLRVRSRLVASCPALDLNTVRLQRSFQGGALIDPCLGGGVKLIRCSIFSDVHKESQIIPQRVKSTQNDNLG